MNNIIVVAFLMKILFTYVHQPQQSFAFIAIIFQRLYHWLKRSSQLSLLKQLFGGGDAID